MERFFENVQYLANGCWQWTGSVDVFGYGRIGVGKKTYKAHRVSYIHHKGPFPAGTQPDHLCRNKACVNPDHLEAVTPRVNILRSTGPSAVNARKLRCKRGHELTTDNLMISVRPTGVERQCRICHKLRKEAWEQGISVAALAA